ncbi:MAG: ferritin-like domain-containing protein [Actinobacteria bacterium]|nr:ferritin-like domain-containing protein [Actinomycetota bacterium]
MSPFASAMSRFLDRESRTQEETSVALMGGLTRRSLFRVGGVTIAGAALLAACGGDDDDTASTAGSATTQPTTTMAPATSMAPGTTAAPMSNDVVLLRTISSLENLAVAAYQIAIDSGLVTTAAVGDAAKLFQSHHIEHAQFFQSATKNAGGEPFTDPNPAVLAQLQPTIDGLQDEQGVLQLALDLERAAAASYQSGVGVVTDLSLNKALISVGGVEARHAAVLAGVLMMDAVPRAFGTTEGAVPAGTGV